MPAADPSSDPATVIAAAITAAINGRAAAYAPYSRFKVGAALVCDRGEVHAGCNVENAAYPEGTCAEAGAIAAMVLAGGRRITAAVIAGPEGAPCMPCGGCRQKLREFAGPGLEVLMVDPHGTVLATRQLAALLPDAFGPDMLD